MTETYDAIACADWHCPFCGWQNGRIVMLRGAGSCFVHCQYCKAAGPLAKTEDDAVRRWNQRVPRSGDIRRIMPSIAPDYLTITKAIVVEDQEPG